MNGGFDVGKEDSPPLPTLPGWERGRDLLVRRGVQPAHGEGWTQAGSQRGKARGKGKEQEKGKTEKRPAWVERMKHMRSDSASKEKGMAAPWVRAAAGKTVIGERVPAEGERGSDGIIRGSEEDLMWGEWEDTRSPPTNTLHPEPGETEEDNEEFMEGELMDGVPQTELTEEELRKAELMVEEMERETTLRPHGVGE